MVCGIYIMVCFHRGNKFHLKSTVCNFQNIFPILLAIKTLSLYSLLIHKTHTNKFKYEIFIRIKYISNKKQKETKQ